MDHERHEMARKERKDFVCFAFFRDLRDPNAPLPTDCPSQRALEATAAGEAALLREVDVEIDRLAAELWVLTVSELRESLPELG